jgi:hypothetical protein
MRGCFPDDPELENMDPIMRAWMFYNWMEDFEDENKLLENQGYLIGSFTNPELVQKMLGKGSHDISSSDEEFEETSRRIMEINKKIDEEKNKKTRKRKKRKIQG